MAGMVVGSACESTYRASSQPDSPIQAPVARPTTGEIAITTGTAPDGMCTMVGMHVRCLVKRGTARGGIGAGAIRDLGGISTDTL